MANEAQGTATRQETCDAFQALYDALTDGYWAATTIEDKDRIRGVADAVAEIVTKLNQDDIESRDSEFKAVTATVKGIFPRMQKLKKEVDTIIHAVKVADTVAKAIDKALEAAGKYLKI